MAPVLGPDTVSGRPDRRETNERLGEDTSSLTHTGIGERMTTGNRTGSGLETVATTGTGEPALAPGEQLGEFEIDRQIGSGGMGQVFAARRIAGQAGVGEPEIVALKYLERTSASTLYRFKQEFRALAGVTHENLVELGELVARPDLGTFFTMELLDGVAFDEYVRGRTPVGELPNLARLRRAFKQLVAGVDHLHQHDCIHRDLKPSNVLVTAEGRVVILDFGLVQDHSGDGAEGPDQQIMGTPAYMSPEQAGLERAGPAADWYSVGVMMFECLTGKRPFRGSITHLLFAKREYDPPAVTDVVANAPDDLAELCRRLIARRPSDRPSGREIAASLDGIASLDEPAPTSKRVPFLGRRSELDQLAEAFADLHASDPANPGGHRQITVHVRGRSGYGKSSLVREFLAGVRHREQATVLRGRCLERESVPYKGLDPVIDALSVVLRQLPREELDALVPEHPVALIRLFPVLDEVWTIEQLRAVGRNLGPIAGVDVHELRQRAFASLRTLLGQVANRRPLIIHIDDFQWGNVDSARLLTELLRPPDAPTVLVVIGYRDEVETNETLQALTAAEAIGDRDVREILVGPLARADARELAIALMGEGGDPAVADAYAAQAEGSPFYLGQMVYGASLEGTTPGAGASPGQLDQIVVRRIHQLDPASRRLLEVVAVAGGPIGSEAAFAALDLDDPEALVPALRAAELLRVRLHSGHAHLSVTLETAHDRIREVTVGELEPAQLREIHLRLAVALESSGSDPEALAEHFERGGDRARAAEYTERAAEQAASSLAFARAVALYRSSLALLPDDADPERVATLRQRLAEQLINSGSGHEAARLLLALAEFHEQPERRALAHARELRRQAADQLIKTGHVEAGLTELDRLLRSVGLRLPHGTAAAVAALVWEQARLRIRGFNYQPRRADQIAPELLDQIDTCFAVVNGLSTQETLLSALFHYRNLRLSLTAGEPARVARALAYQCIIDVAGGDWRRVEQQFATARQLAAEVDQSAGTPANSDHSQLLGFIDLCDASTQWFERRFIASSVRHTKIIASLEGVAGAAWDRRTAQIHHMWTLLNQGQLREFWTRAKGTSERARERGDMQEMVEVSAFSAIALVLAGKPDEARRTLATAQADWNPGRYLFGDVWACFGWVVILIDEGEPEAAVARSKEALAQMQRTFLDQSATARRNAQEHLCRSLVATAVLRDDPGYAKRARQLAAKLRSEQNDVLTANMALVDAALASMVGDRSAALGFWSEAAALFEAHGIHGHIAAIGVRMAALLDGPTAQDWASRASDYFEREAIADIDGFCRVLAPANMTRLTESR